MSTRSPRHRGTTPSRLTLPERRFVVAVVTLAVLLAISLFRQLWLVLGG